MGMPRDLAGYMARQRRAAAPQPVSTTQIGGGGRAPGERFRVGGAEPAAEPAPADEPAPEPAPAPAPAPASAVVSTPPPVAVEEPTVDINAELLANQQAFFERQEAAAAARREEQLRVDRRSAYDIISRTLDTYGLGELSGFVQDMVFNRNILDQNILIGELREQDAYKRRFAGNEQRRRAGLNALSEGEYIALETAYAQLMRQSGLPVGFYDSSDDFTNLIGGNVSVGELSERVNQGYEAVRNADPEVVDEMRRLYNIGEGELAAYFLDPERATPTLIQQARAAQVAGQGVRQAGYQITAAQAEELARAGISTEQARAGFQAIASAQELFGALPGEAEQDITQEEQIAGVFGTSAAAQQRIRRRTRERQAEFEAGGGFAAQGSQVTGLT